MPTYSTDRRSLLKIIGAVGATCAHPFSNDELYGQTMEHAHAAPLQVATASLHFFNQADFATISRIADLIIPPGETPGAIGAGVPEYIDLVIARTLDHQLIVADGLRWLDAEAERLANGKFIALNEAQQLGILEPLCKAADVSDLRGRNVQFFHLLKSLTADGYYTSQTGLMQELKYNGNIARPEFPSCS